MNLNYRPYAGVDDYWNVRGFLREVFQCNGRRQRSWDVARWDYWRWHGVENITQAPLETVIFLWEQADGRIAAVANAEGPGEAHFQVDPRFRSPDLEAAMLAAAETHLAETAKDGRRKLVIWAHEQDALRCDLLEQHGYTRGNDPEHQRRRSLIRPVPDAKPAEGYTIRALREESELPSRSWASWRAFHPDDPDSKYEGWEWYRNVQRCPLYRRDLDIVAEAPDGAIAGFCTVWFDDATRAAVFEPVGVMPEHQRKGLGRAMMTEGLRRVQHLGADYATVGSYGEGAHALYAAMGFTEFELSYPWQKKFS